MHIVDKILYLSEAFCKTAEVVNLPISGFKAKLDWLLDKNLPDEEIIKWLELNATTLDNYNIRSLLKFDPDFHNKILKLYGENESITISLKDKLDKDFKYDIKSSAFLKGYKHIPNFYLFKTEPSGFNSEPIKVEFAHDAFLYKAIKYILYAENKSSSYDDNDIYNFIIKHSSSVSKMKSMFEYSPKVLGEGDDGMAFDVGKNRVLKIFRDSFSYMKAKESMERLFKNPELAKTEAMIYDVGIIGQMGDFNGFTIYYYVMEKVKPLLSNTRNYLSEILNIVGNYIKQNKSNLDKIKSEIYNPDRQKDVKIIIDAASNKLEEFITNNHKNAVDYIRTANDLNDNWLKNLCEEVIFKYLTSRADLHLGNIGITNYNNFKYFDAAHSYWEDNDDVVNLPSRDSVDFGFEELNG